MDKIIIRRNNDSDRRPNESSRIYRIDKFIVPNHAPNEFLDKVHRTHEFLRTLPGFLQDYVLEQTGGPGEFNFITIAVWDSAESLENAKQAVMARHKEMGFNLQEIFARLGIKADLANYNSIS